MERQLITDIKSFFLEKPVLVFTEKVPKEMLELLTAAFPKLKIEEITTPKHAEHARKFHYSRTTGIYVVAVDFARGYDLKLARDAHVFVVAYENGFSISQVKQMVGRGSRAFGQAEGTYYTYEFGNRNENISQHLAKKEPEYHNSHILLGHLFMQWQAMGLDQKTQAISAFSAGGWRVKNNEFERNHP